MREIKFRAWDTVDKQMYSWAFMMQSGDGRALSIREVLNKTHEEWLEVMQFTGLCDKNGKEIYEGDITKGGYIVRSIFGCWCLDKGETPFLYECKDVEVIGNIHENPELLGGE